MKDEQQQDKTDEPDIADVSPTQQVSLVIDDVRALVRAELNYYRSRLDYSRHVMKRSAGFGFVAALAFMAAAIALVVGLVLTLAPYIGPGMATLAVTLGFILIGAISGNQAQKWAAKVRFPEIDKDDDEAA
jgi:predicted Abi (CAAX) family protease